jgi:hypothetical protein
MAEKILQVNFKFHVSRAEYEDVANSVATAFAAVPGCRWKIWLMNETEREAGGLYLFDNDAAVDALLQSDLIAGVLAHPGLSDFSVKRFDVLPAVSAVTRAPLHAIATGEPSATPHRANMAH